MHKLCFYVPESHLKSVKQALFDVGAGRIGNYDQCAWQCKGEGQFRPLEGSDPTIGEQGRLEAVVEYRVDIICQDKYLQAAIAALKQSHPYEHPAFQYWQANG